MKGLKKIFITIVIIEFITIVIALSSFVIDYKSLTKKVIENINNITNNYTTIILVQEEQEMSITEIVEEEPDAEVYIPEKYKALCIKLCEENDVPLYIFAKLIQSESRWVIKAKNINYVYNKDGTPVLNKDGTRKIHSIDKGIAMLNNLNYEEFSWRFNLNREVDPYDTTMSLTISCRYLSWIYDRTHSWYDSVCAYKSGLTKVRTERVPIHIQSISKAIIDAKISALDPDYFP